MAYQQGTVFNNFKMNKAFSNAVTEFVISKTTINYKVDKVNFINRHSGIKKSSISLSCLKNKLKVINVFAKNMLPNLYKNFFG